MKRHLINGILFIGAVALSSCSATKLASIKNAANNDDVYYTSAKAGDLPDYIATNNQQSREYRGDDDYYYYGDYASRINRFNNLTPFDYDDNFYFTYVPYNNGFGEGLGYDQTNYNYGNYSTTNNNNTTYADNNYVYSPYNYGYSPYYDMGYDDYGYGDMYSASLFIGGGGGGGFGGSFYGTTLHNRKNTGTTVTGVGYNPAVRGIRTTPSQGVTRIAASLPGRPSVSVNTNTGVVTHVNLTGINNPNNNTASRQTRESYSPQQQSISRPSVSAPAPSSSSSSSSAAGGSSGGGGRPGRP